MNFSNQKLKAFYSFKMYLLLGFYIAKIACFHLALYAYLKLQSEQKESSRKHVRMASEIINSESAAENVHSLVTSEIFKELLQT